MRVRRVVSRWSQECEPNDASTRILSESASVRGTRPNGGRCCLASPQGLARSSRIDWISGSTTAAHRQTGELSRRRGREERLGQAGRVGGHPGHIGNEPVGVVMMDHPGNPRHPTYWHSRGYGLHAINPFGVRDFLKDKTRNGGLTIEQGQHVRFRYRVVIHPGLSPELSRRSFARPRTRSRARTTPCAWEWSVSTAGARRTSMRT